MTSRPIIGVTRPSVGDVLSYHAIALGVRLAGGRPVRLDASGWENIQLDGLVLSGGSDVFPGRFQIRAKADYRYDHPREQMELALLERALAEGLPILGICRGAQLMNVAAGGSLHMDVAQRFHPTPYPQHWLRQLHFRKRVAITPGSRLHAILGRERLWVNSIHSQAVDRVGDGFTVCAREANGVVQAIERSDRHFCIGVQFHPELLLHRRAFRRLFEALVLSAQAFQASRQGADAGVALPAGWRGGRRALHRSL